MDGGAWIGLSLLVAIALVFVLGRRKGRALAAAAFAAAHASGRAELQAELAASASAVAAGGSVAVHFGTGSLGVNDDERGIYDDYLAWRRERDRAELSRVRPLYELDAHAYGVGDVLDGVHERQPQAVGNGGTFPDRYPVDRAIPRDRDS